MNRYAITFTVRSGTQDDVARVLSSYRRPPAGAAGGPRLLLRTSVFLQGNRVVRIMDVDTDLETALRHLAAQPQIQAVELALNDYLEKPRDFDDPSGITEFITAAAMDPVLHRTTPEQMRPNVPPEQRGQRCALVYPARPGCGGQVGQLLADARKVDVQASVGTVLASTTIFVKDDVVVRLIELDGSPEEALDHLAEVAARAPVTPELGRLLATDHDLTTRDGFRAFLADAAMTLLTDRRVGAPS